MLKGMLKQRGSSCDTVLPTRSASVVHIFTICTCMASWIKLYLWKFLMRAEIVIEKLCSVTFNLRAIKQVVTVPQGQKLVITKMKNIKCRSKIFKAKVEHQPIAQIRQIQLNLFMQTCMWKNVLFGHVIMSICYFPFLHLFS